MKMFLPKPAPEVKALNGDTIGTVENFFRDSDGDIREITVQLFARKEETPHALTAEEYGAIMWNAGISKTDAMDVLFALSEAGVFPMRKAT